MMHWMMVSAFIVGLLAGYAAMFYAFAQVLVLMDQSHLQSLAM